MADAICPCCNVNLSEQDESLQEKIYHCKICHGILASENWLGVNLEKNDFLRLIKAVFEGKSVKLKCPDCRGDMVRGRLSPGDRSYEVEGCIGCHSIWFDSRELELFTNKKILPLHDNQLENDLGINQVSLLDRITFVDLLSRIFR